MPYNHLERHTFEIAIFPRFSSLWLGISYMGVQGDENGKPYKLEDQAQRRLISWESNILMYQIALNWSIDLFLWKKNIWNWILMHFNCNRKSQRFFKYILYDYLMTAQRAKMRKKCNLAFTWLGQYFEFGSKGNFFSIRNHAFFFCFSRLYQFYIYMLLQQKFVLVIVKMKIHVTNSGLKMEK